MDEHEQNLDASFSHTARLKFAAMQQRVVRRSPVARMQEHFL